MEVSNTTETKLTQEQLFEESFKKITDELSKDLDLDETDIEGDLIKTPKLFTKWRHKLSVESMSLAVISNNKAKLYKDLYMYYLKKAPDDMYKRKGAVGIIIPKTDVNTFIYADVEWITLQLRLEYQIQIVRYIENAMTRISSRQHELREIIKWRIFEAGEH